MKGIVKGNITSKNRDIALSGGLKAVEELKATAMGQAINHYTDEEVLRHLGIFKLYMQLCLLQLCNLVGTLANLAEECNITRPLDSFRVAHDVLFREARMIIIAFYILNNYTCMNANNS